MKCRIQRTFGAGLPALASKKCLFSYQTDKPISFVLNVLQVGHLRTLFFNQVWYDRRKTRIFH